MAEKAETAPRRRGRGCAGCLIQVMILLIVFVAIGVTVWILNGEKMVEGFRVLFEKLDNL